MASQKGTENWKTKKWFVVCAPQTFNEAQLGEMPGKDEKSVLGRNVHVSLDTLTGNPQNANMNLIFKVTEVKGDKALTKLTEMALLFSFIRTMVRRHKSVSTTVVRGTSKDGILITVKPIVITGQRSAASRLIGIRKETNEFISAYISGNESDSIVKSVIDGSMQQELYTKLRHVAPLSKVEIRKLELGR